MEGGGGFLDKSSAENSKGVLARVVGTVKVRRPARTESLLCSLAQFGARRLANLALGKQLLQATSEEVGLGHGCGEGRARASWVVHCALTTKQCLATTESVFVRSSHQGEPLLFTEAQTPRQHIRGRLTKTPCRQLHYQKCLRKFTNSILRHRPLDEEPISVLGL